MTKLSDDNRPVTEDGLQQSRFPSLGDAVIESLPVGVVVFDSELRILMSNSASRVLLADDHALLRAGLKLLFNENDNWHSKK